jgi:hypothetical protein
MSANLLTFRPAVAEWAIGRVSPTPESFRFTIAPRRVDKAAGVVEPLDEEIKRVRGELG